MRRTLAILFGLVAAGIAAFGVSYLLTQRICAQHLINPADDLAWLRQEFRLSEEEMANIRKLHDGYLPKCAKMCKEIAAKKREVETSMEGVTDPAGMPDIVGKKLGELALLRAQCQAQMLQHFVEVSRAMPPEQGRRYLDKMRQLTLGSHEQIEKSMSESTRSGHGHE